MRTERECVAEWAEKLRDQKRRGTELSEHGIQSSDWDIIEKKP